MSFSTETLCLQKISRTHYLSLPTAPLCQVTYVWISPSGTLPKSKTRTLEAEPRGIQDVPEWYATQSVQRVTSELTLVPVVMFRDPFTLDPNKLVLCETRDSTDAPAAGNQRTACAKAMEAVKDQKPWFGMEQEYMLMGLDGLPFGWASSECPTSTGVSARVGLDKAYGRDVCMSHYNACVYAGLKIGGTTSEVIPAQWEFQIGPCEGVELADHVWMSRYILFRVCEDFGLVPSFHPKPIEHPRWASGGHVNFSTEAMRSEGGLKHIEAAIERMSLHHSEHMSVYGSDNEMRLNSVGLNSSFSEFTSAVGSRKVSVRIPGHVSRGGRGYLEDRRPASNCDPYLVTKALVETCLMSEKKHNDENISEGDHV